MVSLHGWLAVLALSASLIAHGGQYRGPGTPYTPPRPGLRVTLPPGAGPVGPVGPKTGGPMTPAQPAVPTGGPAVPGTPITTGGAPEISFEVSWQVWWELNKDPFVLQRSAIRSAPTTGSDDFWLGPRRAAPSIDTLWPTEADCRERIVPALAALMEKERNGDVQTACMVALARIGLDGTDIDLIELLQSRLSRDDQEVRETAALALGITGRAAAVATLRGLLLDDAEGRRFCGDSPVSDRTRAFAAYGLGLLARRSEDGSTRQQAHDLLWALLQDKGIKGRDLRVAAVTGLGILCDPDRSGHKRLAWQIVDELMGWYQLDLGRGDEAIQAHAPVAIGRLLGRGRSQLHQRCKQHFAAVLIDDDKRSNPILQSAALALGMLTMPAEQHADEAAFAKALQVHWEKGIDRLARNFAVIGLGRIGGAANREWLATTYARCNKNLERPWVAIALGLVAAAAAEAGTVDVATATMLAADLERASMPELQAALAVALGLTGHSAASDRVQRLLRANEHDEMLAGYLCIGLALLDDPASVPVLGDIMSRSRRRPFLLLQAAVGLGRLGDRTANEELLAMMRDSDSLAVLSALANAIGQIGDRRAIEPLITMTGDNELTKLTRAFVAAALGGVGDGPILPWNQPISRDSNYGAPVDTLSNGRTGVLDIL
ncbi:MAG: HEAT repeat domain-containing protein [Planctomycetes bacterium]|jgi:HEAT repeat protein|nr:HEAT repeat domain-containing protein [Planctomycetota bacterium]